MSLPLAARQSEVKAGRECVDLLMTLPPEL